MSPASRAAAPRQATLALAASAFALAGLENVWVTDVELKDEINVLLLLKEPEDGKNPFDPKSPGGY
jgi:hypothetical protein